MCHAWIMFDVGSPDAPSFKASSKPCFSAICCCRLTISKSNLQWLAQLIVSCLYQWKVLSVAHVVLTPHCPTPSMDNCLNCNMTKRCWTDHISSTSMEGLPCQSFLILSLLSGGISESLQDVVWRPRTQICTNNWREYHATSWKPPLAKENPKDIQTMFREKHTVPACP
jgi:hypothetical protein